MIMPQESLIVEAVPVLGDNYVWMFACNSNEYVAVDPGEATAVSQWLNERGASLSHILLTHHHADHIGGVAELQKKYGAEIIGSQADAQRLPILDHAVVEGDCLNVGECQIKVIDTPGHTIGHVIYRTADALFVGDTLFSMGCGRLFEGSPDVMWQSLQKIKNLPDATKIYPAHEYTLTNHGFAITLEPDNQELIALKKELLIKNDNDTPTLPTTLATEKKLNPFLRTEDSQLAEKLGLKDKSPVERFAILREKRNHF
ncbi:MAG: hydroxyacylglutathione hydrolase [Magnetococcales bacterium]|nr:hydroxyacylglutathione hydrolase [Magnetococcales bacterium]